jgi:hypothetical protein
VPADDVVEEVDEEEGDGVDAEGQQGREEREGVAEADLPQSGGGGGRECDNSYLTIYLYLSIYLSIYLYLGRSRTHTCPRERAGAAGGWVKIVEWLRGISSKQILQNLCLY